MKRTVVELHCFALVTALILGACSTGRPYQPQDGGPDSVSSGSGGGAGKGAGGAGGHASGGAGGHAGTGGAGGATDGGATDAAKDPSLGHSCSSGTDCGSGFCVQGVCCSSACTDSCYACTNALTGSSPDGTCAVVSSGLADPAGGCATGTAASCGNTGHCDGKGACEKFGSSTVCLAASCGGGGFTSSSTCDGKGSCTPGTTTDCKGFTCTATTGCATKCAADTDCPGGYCTAGKTCAATFSDGSTCSASDQCTNGNCISGVCCATACTGTCMTCATGACKPVAAGGSSNGACAVGTTTCGHDGFCDGNGGCRNAISTVACGSASCSGGQLTPVGTCNGAGACSTPAPSGCPGGVACASATTCKASTCAADADCLSGLCQSGVCAGKRPNGQACTATDQCTSGFCADGVCCTSACNGTCQACTNALTGSSPDGTCAAVSSGLADPAGGCTAGTPVSCGNTGHCDGKGACEKFGSSTVCLAASCGSAGFTAGSICDGKGNCTAGTTTGCKGFSCSATTGCATSCSADTDCPGGYCTSAMTCAATMSDGSTCSKSSQCTHASCVSGICCATACAGTCMTCATGQCKPVTAGVPSAGVCPIDPTPCGHDGTCDGNGGCRYAISSVSCGSPSCSGGQLAPIGSCNGAGACTMPAASGCPGAVVCASTTACKSSTCAADADCVSGLCLSGACMAKRAIGQACTANDQCTGGSCVDGVCCNSACNGTCQGCDESTGGHTPGTCATISGAPRSGHGSCMGTGVCVSACNGSSASCVFPTSSMSCRSASCSGGSQTLAAGCDGAGNCPPAVTQGCGQFICGATSCLNNCSSNSQCLSGDACVSGVCTTCTSGQSVCANACANLSSDGANCGACGHSCLGGTCTSGTCLPVTLATLPGATQLALNSTTVFTTLPGNGTRTWALYGVPKTAVNSSPSPILTRGAGDLNSGPLFANDTLLFGQSGYTGQGGTGLNVFSCNPTNCSGTAQAWFNEAGAPVACDPAAQECFVSTYQGQMSATIQFAKQGTASQTSPQDFSPVLTTANGGLAAAGGYLYIAGIGPAGNLTPIAILQRVLETGTGAISLLANLGPVTGNVQLDTPLAVTSTRVYLLGIDSTPQSGLISIPLPNGFGNSAPPFLAGTTLSLSAPQSGAWGDDTAIYFINAAQQWVTCPASGCTGAPTVLADASSSSGLMVGDAQAIYWLNTLAGSGSAVMKLAR